MTVSGMVVVPTPEDVDAMATAVDRIVGTTGVELLVQDYFDAERCPFAAATFDELAPNEAGAIGVADLLAVSLLDAAFAPSAVRRLVAGEADAAVAAIPSGVDLWEADDSALEAAQAAWELLVGLPNVGPVKAGKLLARKRPRLIPIWDDVVPRLLPAPVRGFWTTLRAVLGDRGRCERIEELRPTDAATTASTLRLLDVAVWMSGSESENARESRNRHHVPPAGSPTKSM